MLAITGLPNTTPTPSRSSFHQPWRGRSEGGSGLRIQASESAETRKLKASTAMVWAAPTAWTKKPASPGPVISATDSLTCIRLLATRISSLPTREGT